MRILYHHRVGSKDGQFVHIDEMVHALRSLGHEVRIAGPGAYEESGFGQQMRLVAWLKRFLPRFVYELAELAFSIPDYVRLKRAAREFQPDFIYERYNLYLLSGLSLARRMRLPLLLEVNAPLAEERARYGGLGLPALARWAERRVWRGAHRVFVVTDVLGDHVRGVGVPDARIVVTPNGVGAEFLEPVDGAAARTAAGLGNRLVLGFTGFVREWHRLDLVVDLVARNRERDWHLVVVGDGPARAALAAQAARLGVHDRVTFTGVVGRDRIRDWVATFDVALQPSVVPYASPLKIVEYLALGRAIVAPASRNIMEVLRDGENALLFPPEDPAAFAAAIERLSNDSDLRARLATAARRTIEARDLTWVANARTAERHARALLAAPAGAGARALEEGG